MKKSELFKEIKNHITEILSEIDLDKTSGAVILPKNTSVSDIKKLTSQDIDVTLKEKKESDDEIEDTWNKPDKNDVDFSDKEPTKSDIKKEKISTVSKFKTSTDDFNNFKDKLKTIVDKIKGMEKGEEKNNKLAALKQFIKKPELVKAFKERSVEIDTGDLIG